MQVVACIKTSRTTSTANTRSRILEAATRVFARSGLSGSTTRNIALEAGVNEVTLFRHFQSKDRLLAAVVGRSFGEQVPSEQVTPPPFTDDLRADLLSLGRHYERLLTENLPLVRTMLGEIQHHHRSHERQVFIGIFRPLKESVLARIQLAQKKGDIRADVLPEIIADLFGGMVFAGAIRRASVHIKLPYSEAAYLEASVTTLLQGMVNSPARP